MGRNIERKNIFFLCQKESGAKLVGWSSNSNIEAAGWRLAQVQLPGAKLKSQAPKLAKKQQLQSQNQTKTENETETETERLRLKLTSSLGAQVARAWAADGWVTHTICETLTPTQQTWRNGFQNLLQLKDTVFERMVFELYILQIIYFVQKQKITSRKSMFTERKKVSNNPILETWKNLFRK